MIARTSLTPGDYIAAGREARAAHASAEAAFSHPAILAQLSFPESHKLGVRYWCPCLPDAQSVFIQTAVLLIAPCIECLHLGCGAPTGFMHRTCSLGSAKSVHALVLPCPPHSNARPTSRGAAPCSMQQESWEGMRKTFSFIVLKCSSVFRGSTVIAVSNAFFRSKANSSDFLGGFGGKEDYDMEPVRDCQSPQGGEKHCAKFWNVRKVVSHCSCNETDALGQKDQAMTVSDWCGAVWEEALEDRIGFQSCTCLQGQLS
eukprot:1158194-Pelagomonas_calceolata.AAC.5